MNSDNNKNRPRINTDLSEGKRRNSKIETEKIRSERKISEDLLFESETRAIIGAAIEVINTIGHGLLEKPYEKALAVEFSLQGIPFDR